MFFDASITLLPFSSILPKIFMIASPVSNFHGNENVLMLCWQSKDDSIKKWRERHFFWVSRSISPWKYTGSSWRHFDRILFSSPSATCNKILWSEYKREQRINFHILDLWEQRKRKWNPLLNKRLKSLSLTIVSIHTDLLCKFFLIFFLFTFFQCNRLKKIFASWEEIVSNIWEFVDEFFQMCPLDLITTWNKTMKMFTKRWCLYQWQQKIRKHIHQSIRYFSMFIRDMNFSFIIKWWRNYQNFFFYVQNWSKNRRLTRVAGIQCFWTILMHKCLLFF